MNLNPSGEQQITKQFSPGEEIFSWQALDYHPHQRGIIWYIVFCLVFFGGAIWAMITDPQWGWLMALPFFLVAAVYFLAHQKGAEKHEIQVFEKGIFIDRKFFPLEKFAGFWILYDETVAIINLQVKTKFRKYNLSLQMGEHEPDFFRENFRQVGLSELEDEHESLLDLWIRVLKL